MQLMRYHGVLLGLRTSKEYTPCQCSGSITLIDGNPRTNLKYLDQNPRIPPRLPWPLTETKRRIAARIDQFSLTVTGEVVKQEFKRRLLKEAQYLLNLFGRYRSFQRVQRHVVDNLPPIQQRKRNISLQLLTTIFEGESDLELAERSTRYLRMLIKYGLDDFEDGVGSIVRDAGCACARYPVKETKRNSNQQFDFGSDRCTKTQGACQIGVFLELCRGLIERILDHLGSVLRIDKTAELIKIEEFLARYLNDFSRAAEADPCLTVGDLLIALESAAVPAFYTMNYRESQQLCRSTGQTLIIRPTNPERDDEIQPAGDAQPAPSDA